MGVHRNGARVGRQRRNLVVEQFDSVVEFDESRVDGQRLPAAGGSRSHDCGDVAELSDGPCDLLATVVVPNVAVQVSRIEPEGASIGFDGQVQDAVEVDFDLQPATWLHEP